MKTQLITPMKYALLMILTCTLAAQLAAQCSVSSPKEVAPFFPQYDWEGKWNHVSLSGDQGEDYFSFYAEVGNTYVFSTMPAFGGSTTGIPNDDTQFSVLDVYNQAAPGRFGNAFHDDFYYGPFWTDYKPTFAWSPSQTGTYRLLVTKYMNYVGCQELGMGDHVTVAFRRIPRTYNFAVWTGAQHADFYADYCWLSRGTSGAPGSGLNTALDQAYALFDSDAGASVGAITTHRPPSSHMSITVCKMVIGPRQTLEIYSQTELVITSELIMPMTWEPFAFLPSVGRIESSSAASPGTVRLLGANANMNIPNNGNIQNIRLVLESGQNTSISGIGSPFEGESVFAEIEIKGNADFYIGGKVRVKNKIYFHSDQVIGVGSTDPYSYLKLDEATQVIGANEKRFISVGAGRPVIKAWSSTQPFELPIGDCIHPSKYYAPVNITPTSATATEWSCTYQRNNPYYHAGPQHGGIDHISRYDRWTVDSDVANAQATITVQWNPGSQVGQQLNDLTIAGYDLNYAWQNVGGNSVTGTSQVGQITSNTIVPNQYSEFSIASTTANHGFRLGQQPIADISFTCFPNPATSYTQIELEHPLPTAMSFRMIDTQGREVHQVEMLAGQKSASLNISHLSAGTYYVVADQQRAKPFKVVKK